jgi:hypothetical protein
MSNWIAISTTIHERPEVQGLAEILGISEDAVVGLLVRFWAWADRESVDGCVEFIRERQIDAIVKHQGFAAAMERVRWLGFDDAGAHVPKFDRWMGQSAKRRQQDARRKQQERKRKAVGQ